MTGLSSAEVSKQPFKGIAGGIRKFPPAKSFLALYRIFSLVFGIKLSAF